MTATVHRPLGVGILSILLMIGGILDIVGGVFILVQRNDNALLDAIDVSDTSITTYGIVAIAFGVIVLLVGSAMRKGANWARLLVAIIAAFRLGSLIWVVLAYHNIHWYNAVWPTVFYAFVAGYLFFDDDAKEFYERS